METKLKDKTVIITGASSGISAAAAFLFASNWENVVLGARRETQLNEVTTQTGLEFVP